MASADRAACPRVGSGALARVVPALQLQQAVHDPAGVHAHALARGLALAAPHGSQGAAR